MTSTELRIADAFVSALRDGGPTWFPTLGRGPSDAAWASPPLAGAGIGPDDYGTARVRAGDVSAARRVVQAIEAPACFGRDRPILVETLTADVAARYEELGLDLADPSAAEAAQVAAKLEAALDRLAAVPSLAEAVGRVLHVIHVAVPESPDFDVGFSDPMVPFSVWIGISGEDSALTDLRLAEGLLHEAMHLQLSLIEEHVPLVTASGTCLHSPWRNERRPVQGVLHGTYVFAVIREFMVALRDAGLADGTERRHVEGRIATCAAEIADAVASLRASTGLTARGRALVECLAMRSRL